MSLNVPSSRRNARLAAVCVAGIALMGGAAYASVPLYKAFCQLTGFDGATRRAEVAPDQVLARTLKVRFDANVRDLPWRFQAVETSQMARIGETKVAHFRVTNTGSKAVTGRAVFNVVPEQAGPYFRKLECFCYTDQTIGAGESVDMPVLYFIDPEFATDANTRGKQEVTLSYTFYPSETPQAQDQAQAAASALGGPLRAGL